MLARLQNKTVDKVNIFKPNWQSRTSSVIGKLDNVWKQSRRSLRKKLRIHTSCVQSNPQGWRQTVASLSHAVSAPHSWYPVVRLRDKLIIAKQTGVPDIPVRAVIGDSRLAVGHTRQTLARKRTSAQRCASVCWTARRHHISPWLEEKARKTTKQLAAWCSQGRTTHYTRGLDSGWWSRRMDNETILCWLRVLTVLLSLSLSLRSP